MQKPTTGPRSTPSRSFTLFPLLPTELRLQIWTLILASSLPPPAVAKTFATSTRNPTLFNVNREARNEALRVYQPYFTRISSPHLEPQAQSATSDSQQETPAQLQLETDQVQVQVRTAYPRPRPIYIAFNPEILRLREDVLAYIREPELHLIEQMVVEVADVPYFGHFYLDIIRRTSRLRKLELLMGITDSDRLLAGTGQGTDAGEPEGSEEWWERGMRSFGRGVELLKEEFREAREERKCWVRPDVSIVMRGTGVVVGVIEGGRESLMEEEESPEPGIQA
ncbi:hypothetical protein BDW66DRAFT_152605 [Aspergillus desertorum]